MAVGVEIAVGFGGMVGGKVAVEVGAVICAPVQPESNRQKEAKIVNIRSKFDLMIAFRGLAQGCSSWSGMAC